jgi:hypothetical protein
MMTDKTDEWPYDADRDDPLTALRIPVVDSPHPHWAYIVALDTGAKRGKEWLRPTDLEATQLQSFLRQYIEHWYTPFWKDRLTERPFDIDCQANGVVFYKYDDGDWAYRKNSWEQPLYWPSYPAARPLKQPAALTLVELMDQIYSSDTDPGGVRPKWAEWKAAHPEVFGEGQA